MAKKIRVWDGSAWQDVAPSLPYTAIHSAQSSMPLTGVDGQVWLDTDGELTDTAFVPLNTIDAKGDLIVGTSDNTINKLSAGSNNYFLAPDSATSVGLKWAGEWTSFTPTFTGLNIGNGTRSGRYIQIGKMVFLTAQFVMGSTSSVTGQINLTLPNSWVAQTANSPAGLCQLSDAGIAFYAGFAIPNGSNIIFQRIGVTGGNTFFGSVDTTNPFTWGNGDYAYVAIWLEIQ